jgi:DNA-binding MarR family transcriptional regulator
LVDALLSASRVMVGLAARSLADLDSDVTLPQYRALVVLASRGPQRVVDISTELGVNSSTGTRMCERLVRKGLVRRERADTDRREVLFTLTASGEHLVQEVTRRRRKRAGPRRRHGPRGLARAAVHRAAVAGGHRG